MPELIIFTTPLDAHCELRLDNGTALQGHPATHSTGRPGQGFTIPDGSPDGNGCQLTITAPKKVSLLQRGILMLDEVDSFILMDDFHLADEKVCPEIPPPQPPNPPVPGQTPLQIVLATYATGGFDLSTKTGCGKFTEACCTNLHVQNSQQWGHIKKSGAQNQFNGHAVDAIMLLLDSGPQAAGIYDLIVDSESPNARPALNYSGPPIQSLWYYPA